MHQQDLQDNHDITAFLCQTQENINSSKRRLVGKPSNVKRNSTRKDARLEDRSASLAIITIASDDDAIDSADYSGTNNEDKRRDNRKTNRGCAKRTR